ncbi:MAG: peptide ABC transporter substrate-binding protein [Chloroflexi bacterium RBG_13_51_36]|nr:MAG: peptide ABC transporter substrate-binding protein [Chloroflexi bacterium RBG_13_51_36]
MGEILVEARDVKKYFPVNRGVIVLKHLGDIKAVDGVSFTIGKGETFGLVGESGCGKTTTARLILLLETLTGGTIFFDGKDTSELSGPELRKYRASVQAVFQDPYSSLSPRMRVGTIIAEPVVIGGAISTNGIKDRIAQVIKMVGLRRDAMELYPHEFSGGQRQRIAIARALASNPKLIILDEPVSALDVSIRAQIMNLLYDIQQKLGVSYLLIAHNLAVVKHMSKVTGVMYMGKLVEVVESQELYLHPLHPYTQALLSAALPSHPDEQREEIVLPGEVSTPFNPPPGCRLYRRCLYARPVCSEQDPPLKEVSSGHFVACHLH